MSGNGLQYRALLSEELAAVETLLLEVHRLQANVSPLIQKALRSLVMSGGKRLRPALALLSAYLYGSPLPANIYPVAASLEMLHTATLIHDDLLDHAKVRRGHRTLNTRWTMGATVLGGDLAFSWAANLISQGEDTHLMRRFAETLGVICNGELNQLFHGRGTVPTPEAYYERIFAKTASLFELAAEAGPRLRQRPEEEIDRLRHFGRLLGLAFQIADDVLDFMGDEATLGKPVGGDLRQGLITLPVLYYLEQHPDDRRVQAILDRVRAEEPPEESVVQALLVDLRRSQVADRAMATAEAHIEEALGLLEAYPPSPYRAALEEIARFAVRRRY